MSTKLVSSDISMNATGVPGGGFRSLPHGDVICRAVIRAFILLEIPKVPGSPTAGHVAADPEEGVFASMGM